MNKHYLLTMRELKISNYKVTIILPNGTKREEDYKIKESISMVATSPILKLNGRDLLKTAKVLDKIDDCKENTILLEEEEYRHLKSAFEKFQGFSRNERELVERVLEAPMVERVVKSEVKTEDGKEEGNTLK